VKPNKGKRSKKGGKVTDTEAKWVVIWEKQAAAPSGKPPRSKERLQPGVFWGGKGSTSRPHRPRSLQEFLRNHHPKILPKEKDRTEFEKNRSFSIGGDKNKKMNLKLRSATLWVSTTFKNEFFVGF